jgi:hypothetical protein
MKLCLNLFVVFLTWNHTTPRTLEELVLDSSGVQEGFSFALFFLCIKVFRVVQIFLLAKNSYFSLFLCLVASLPLFSVVFGVGPRFIGFFKKFVECSREHADRTPCGMQ